MLSISMSIYEFDHLLMVPRTNSTSLERSAAGCKTNCLKVISIDFVSCIIYPIQLIPKTDIYNILGKRRKYTVQVADQVFRQDVGCTTNNQLFLSFLERGALKLAAGLAITCPGIQVPPQSGGSFQLRLQEVQNYYESVKKGWF